MEHKSAKELVRRVGLHCDGSFCMNSALHRRLKSL